MDHVNVTLAGISNNPPHLLLAETRVTGIHQRVALELDAAFGVEEILIGLPAGQEVELPLDFFFRRQAPFTQVHHDGAVSVQGPVMNLRFRKRRFPSCAFYHLAQSLDSVKQACGRAGTDFAPLRGNAQRIGLA